MSRLFVLAAVIVTGSVLCMAGGVALHVWLARQAPIAPLPLSDIVFSTAWPVAGLLVLRSRPRALAGWVLVSAASIGPYQLLAHYAAANVLVAGGDLPGADLAAWVAIWGFAAFLTTIPLVCLTFPDEVGTSRARHAVLAVVLLAGATAVLFRMVADVEADVSTAVLNPLAVEADWIRYVTLVGATTAIVGGSLAGAVSLVQRARRARGELRLQLQWLMFGVVVLAASNLGGLVPAALGLSGTGPGARAFTDGTFAIGLLAVPVCIGVATVRHRLFGAEVVLERGIVLLASSVLVIAAYVAVVLGIGALTTSHPASSAPQSQQSSLAVPLVAAAALVAAFGRRYVQRGLEGLLFGLRKDPYAVVSRVGRQVAAASEPEEALQRLVGTLRSALRLPYVAFRSADGRIRLEDGVPSPSGGYDVTASALGREFGVLHVGRRSPRDQPVEDERAAIDEVASRAATLAYAAGLVADVAHSRERIVLAREEERRRLRADLHDGIGPTLAGTAHQLDALARRLESDGQERSAERVRGVRDRLRATVGDVRAVVRGLRPPVLDQMGLSRALTALGAGFDVPAVTVEAGGELDGLPAAVEVAVYQIAAEAVTNAIRHSAAATVILRAGDVPGGVALEVVDDGIGIPAVPPAGVGLRSMGERAAEVGGRLDLLPTPGGGTTVRVRFPLGPAREGVAAPAGDDSRDTTRDTTSAADPSARPQTEPDGRPPSGTGTHELRNP